MADLLEGQFECQGVVFGEGTNYIVTRFSPGSSEVEVNDASRPGRHGLYMGRDFRRGSTWSFDISTNRTSGPEALATQARLSAAWRSTNNLEPGESVELRYHLGGRTRKVYGRPRRFVPSDPTQTFKRGRVDVVMDFTSVDDNYYADDQQVISISMTSQPQGGFTFPVTFPLSITAGTGERSGQLIAYGDARSPIKVTFTGPSQNPSLELLGHWKLELDHTLAPNESISVAGGPQDEGIIRGDGAPMPGILTRRSPSLENLTVPAGVHEFVYRATDATASSGVTVVWHDTYTSF